MTFGAPVMAATAEPQPSLKELTAEVERLYTEIETLTEDYNGARVRLKEAQRSADLAKKTLATSETELETRRRTASLLAQNSYMTGGFGSAFALLSADDPDSYLDQASTTYALQMQQGEEVAQVAKAMEAAERARTSAKARQKEVKDLLSGLDEQRDKIRKLVKKSESNLYSKVAGSVTRGSAARRLAFPIIGDGKAAEAARWALTQQLRPYVWGADGPTSFDCSGLVMAAYQTVGISLPHYTGSQWSSGTHIAREDMRPGDLVFFYNDLHHVGIYIGGGYMVHAPRTGDVVRIASLANRPFAGAVRIAD
ncbi:C40 family peptidase [Microtetraspora sp. AC03309]|uniref:C40 family peptidase n=1 Tax=Microtetraspora sp. AC03309 TaxID=2779376 RepID=UPI00272E5265|nr:C40 family peptidase [Microtetraspora sp. AC03309]MCC5578549.1 C40 family peptidase [Microtetraspora sp. AC03309]